MRACAQVLHRAGRLQSWVECIDFAGVPEMKDVPRGCVLVAI